MVRNAKLIVKLCCPCWNLPLILKLLREETFSCNTSHNMFCYYSRKNFDHCYLLQMKMLSFWNQGSNIPLFLGLPSFIPFTFTIANILLEPFVIETFLHLNPQSNSFFVSNEWSRCWITFAMSSLQTGQQYFVCYHPVR